MSRTEAGYGSSLPERKSSAIDAMPGAAMALDERRERPCPARPEHASEQRHLAVAEVFDILHVEVMRLGLEDCGGHGQPSFARFCWILAHDAGGRNHGGGIVAKLRAAQCPGLCLITRRALFCNCERAARTDPQNDKIFSRQPMAIVIHRSWS